MGTPTQAADAPPSVKTARPVAHGPPVQVTFAAFCLVFFASIIFWHNHNIMAYVHSTIQYSMEAPAGWLQSTSRTTVRALTIKNAEGKAVTRAALTATTTTTTMETTTQPTVAAAAAAVSTGAGSKQRPGRNHLKRSSLNTAWRHLPRQAVQRVEAAAPTEAAAAAATEAVSEEATSASTAAPAPAPAPAAVLADAVQTPTSVPQADQDIELQPSRVAQAVQHAKGAEQPQQAKDQEAVKAPAATAAEQYAGLYGADGPGDMLFEPTSDLNTCPPGTASPQGATALVLLADSSSGAAVLKRSLDGLVLEYSGASADVRAGFQLFIGLDGEDTDMTQLAHQYVLDSLGTLKLVHLHHNNNSSSGSGSSVGGSLSSGSADAQPGGDSGVGQAGSSESGGGNDNKQAAGGSVRAQHVRVMLHVLLRCLKYPSVLLLEDDWKLLPDFLDYFGATHWLLTSDPSLYCISAWNPLAQQHGQQQSQPQQPAQQQLQQQPQQPAQQQLQQQPKQQQQQTQQPQLRRQLHQHSSGSTTYQLQRSDSNPGRGWLLSRSTGLLLLNSWPTGGDAVEWQQHIHSIGLQHGRQCVVPEVPRMLPAAVRDTGDTAHIVEQPTAGATAGLDTTAAGEGAADAAPPQAAGNTNSGGSDSSNHQPADGDNTPGSADSRAAGTDARAVDPQAEAGPEVAWTPAADPATAATPVQQDGTAAVTDAGAGSSAGSGKSLQQPLQAHQAQSAWSGRDLSYLLGPSYKRQLHQALLAVKPLDAATAAQLSDSQAAVRVEYATAPELAAAAEALGLHLALSQTRYCYSLPSSPPSQHCQDHLPDTTYEGVVTARTPHGARVYLVHTEYMAALLNHKQPSHLRTTAAATAGAATAGAA